MKKNILKRTSIIYLVVMIFANFTSAYAYNIGQQDIWNIINKSMSNIGNWREVGDGNGKVIFNEDEGYANISKSTLSDNEQGKYLWLASPSNLDLPDNEAFTVKIEARVPAPIASGGSEISIRTKGIDNNENGRISKIFLTYGDDKTGKVTAINWNGDNKVVNIDTTMWHEYTFLIGERDKTTGNRSFDLYIDDNKVFEKIDAAKMKDGDLVRLGADVGNLCNLDVKSVQIGNGTILPEKRKEISEVTLSSYTHKEGSENTIRTSIKTNLVDDGTVFEALLVDSKNIPVSGIRNEGTIINNQGEINLILPDSLKIGTYYVQVKFDNISRNSDQYIITENLEAPVFPTFYSIDEIIKIDDYKYNPTKEFNFPSIVDTKVHPIENSIDRYYMFYAPHDAPAGICLATAPTLDGPWTEYGSNPLISNSWESENGNYYYNVTHVSSPDVMWNSTYNKYFMYFHGENNVTRYATSDDLVNWTYGGECVRANDFSPTGKGLTESSYARVVEHEIPGLDNKYIMTIMINNTANMRKIYYAHSKDGIDWTPVKEALVSPDSDPNMNYAGNISGAYFMEWEGRYYIMCHGSTGNMYSVEVGESLDKEIHWGVFYDSSDSYPDYARSGAPVFIQDDEGVWHMFYEGGKRLHANIIHAKELSDEEKNEIKYVSLKINKPNLIVGENVEPEVEVLLKDNRISDLKNIDLKFNSSNENILKSENGNLIALVQGTVELSVTATYNSKSITSDIVTLGIFENIELPEFKAGETILNSDQLTKGTGSNIQLPSVIKAKDYFESPIDNYYMYFSYVSGSGGIALATAPSPEGPWTPYNYGAPIITSTLSGDSKGDVTGAAPIWNNESSELNMYYSQAKNSVMLATSKDGINFNFKKKVIDLSDFNGKSSQAYQVSVYNNEITDNGNKYTMLLTGNVGGKRQVNYATSQNGEDWEVNEEALITPIDKDKGNIASPRLLIWDNNKYIVFHNSNGDIEIESISDDFRAVQRIGTLYDSVLEEPDSNKASDAWFYEEDNILHMYYTAGSTTGTGSIPSSRIAHTSVVIEVQPTDPGEEPENPGEGTTDPGEQPENPEEGSTDPAEKPTNPIEESNEIGYLPNTGDASSKLPYIASILIVIGIFIFAKKGEKIKV